SVLPRLARRRPAPGETAMEHPGFFERAGPFALGTVAAAANAKLGDGVDPDLALKDVRPLDEADEGDLSFIDNPKYLPAFATTGASACLVAPKFANQAPAATACLVTPETYRGFSRALLLFSPDALNRRPPARGALPVHPTARLEPGAIVEAGAVV